LSAQKNIGDLNQPAGQFIISFAGRQPHLKISSSSEAVQAKIRVLGNGEKLIRTKI